MILKASIASKSIDKFEKKQLVADFGLLTVLSSKLRLICDHNYIVRKFSK